MMQSWVVSTTTVPISIAGAVSAPISVRYRPFGAFRLGLALLVVAQHFQHLLAPADRLVFDRMGFGAIAVAVFFVVSGFVVTEANCVFYQGRPLAFLQNRMLRLAPPYFAALLLSMCVHAMLWRAGALALWDYPVAGPPVTGVRVLAGLCGLLPGLHQIASDPFEFIPFAWSLRMEIAFYVLAAAALLARPVLGKTGLCGAITCGVAGSAVFLCLGRPGILSCAPMFLLGVAICLVARRGGLARCGLLALCVPEAAWGFASWGQHGHPALVWQLPIVAMLVALLAVLATGRLAGGLQRLDQKLGDLSYPLYLTHYVVGITLCGLTTVRSYSVYSVGLCLALLLAAIMTATVDKPLAQRRDRLRRVQL